MINVVFDLAIILLILYYQSSYEYIIGIRNSCFIFSVFVEIERLIIRCIKPYLRESLMAQKI